MRRLPGLVLLAVLFAGCGIKGGKPTDDPVPDGGPTTGTVTADGCPEDIAVFEEVAWEPVLADVCVRCHTAGGAAEGTRMVLAPTSEPGWELTNLRAAATMARIDVDGLPLLLGKPTGQTADGHGGGVVVEVDSVEWNALSLWAQWARGELEACEIPEGASPACDPETPGPRQLRRLSHEEYRNTTRDLLGVSSDPAASFAADDVVAGFDNNAGVLDVSSLLADQYRAAAESLAAETVIAPLLPCAPEGAEAACATLFIEDFGLRAFRRPLTTDDIDRYYTLWASVAHQEGFEEGVRWVITAMLQSPHFLYRMELGENDGAGRFPLTGWEVATELSYLFLATTPDATLLDAAGSGALDTPEGIAEQVARLAADPRAADAVARFVAQWLELDRIQTVSRDESTYPAFDDDTRNMMQGETYRLVSGLSGDGASLGDLFTARHTWATDTLASYYGVAPGTGAADAEGYRYVSLDGVTYGGLLTQGSVLATWALPSSSSPIHRGVLVREHLLCQDLPPPPANLDTSPPEVDPSLSTRERYAAHAANPECALCHDLIDPIGFGFEAYDGVGRWRADDDGHPIDATGEIIGSSDTVGSFDGVFALADLLATSPEVQRCYTMLSVTWATGIAADPHLDCAAGDVADATAPGTIPLTGPMEAVVDLPHFRTRTGGAAEGDTPAAGARSIPTDFPEDSGPWGEPEDNADLVLVINSDWGSGYCVDATVTNNGADAVDWSVHTAMSGAITSLWSANVAEEGSDWVFTGVDWNRTLAPGASTTFGYCGER